MSRKYLTPVKLVNVTSDPTVADGDVWYRSDTDRMMLRANGVSTPVVAGAAQGSFSAFTSGNWYVHSEMTTTLGKLGTASMAAVPFFLGKPATMNGIGIVATDTTVGCTFRMGIYADNGSGVPTTKLVECGTVAGSSTTGFKSITGWTLAMNPGLYWLACASQGADQQMMTMSVNRCYGVGDTTGIGAASGANAAYGISGGVTAALPDPFGTPTFKPAPMFQVKFA